MRSFPWPSATVTLKGVSANHDQCATLHGRMPSTDQRRHPNAEGRGACDALLPVAIGNRYIERGIGESRSMCHVAWPHAMRPYRWVYCGRASSGIPFLPLPVAMGRGGAERRGEADSLQQRQRHTKGAAFAFGAFDGHCSAVQRDNIFDHRQANAHPRLKAGCAV